MATAGRLVVPGREDAIARITVVLNAYAFCRRVGGTMTSVTMCSLRLTAITMRALPSRLSQCLAFATRVI